MSDRQALMDSLIAAGCDVFEPGNPHFPQGVPQYNVLSWLFQHCMASGVQLEGYEVNQVVDHIQAKANRVKASAPSHHLTVKALREMLSGLPENMPVMYQRIEDVYFEKHNWKTVPLTWEAHEASTEEIAYAQEHPSEHMRIEQDGDKTLCRQYSPYVAAFGAYVTKDDEGLRYLCIHAHY